MITQYTSRKTHLCNILQIFTALKMTIFLSKCFDYFHIFAQNIDFGYKLEPPPGDDMTLIYFQTVAEEKFCILFSSDFDVGGNELKFQVWVRFNLACRFCNLRCIVSGLSMTGGATYFVFVVNFLAHLGRRLTR